MQSKRKDTSQSISPERFSGLRFGGVPNILSRVFACLIAQLYLVKEKCRLASEFRELIHHLQREIDTLEDKGLHPVALALRAQQIDNYFCKCGHETRSFSNGEKASTCLEDGEQCAIKAINKLEKLCGGCTDVRTKKELDCAGVWVYGYGAMAYLVSKKYEKARKHIKKAQCSFRNAAGMKIDELSGKELGLEPGILLAAAFLNNCSGRFYRDDFHKNANEAVKYFEKGSILYKLLSEQLSISKEMSGEPHFLHEFALMLVNKARVLLGPLNLKESWENVIPEQQHLDECKNAMKEAEEVHACRAIDGTGPPADRLAFRILYYGAHVEFKTALRMKLLIKCNKNNEPSSKELNQEMKSCLDRAKQALHNCLEEFGDTYAERSKIEKLGGLIDRNTSDLDRASASIEQDTPDRASAGNYEDASSTGTDSKSGKATKRQRSRTKSQCDGASKRRPTDDSSGTNHEYKEDSQTACATRDHVELGESYVSSFPGVHCDGPPTQLSEEEARSAIPGTDKEDCSESEVEKRHFCVSNVKKALPTSGESDVEDKAAFNRATEP